MDPTIMTALIGAASGAFGLEIVRSWFARGTRRQDELVAVRQDFRDRVRELEAKLDTLEAKHQSELDTLEAKYNARIESLERVASDWREKYYEVKAQYTVMFTEVQTLRARVRQLEGDSDFERGSASSSSGPSGPSGGVAGGGSAR